MRTVLRLKIRFFGQGKNPVVRRMDKTDTHSPMNHYKKKRGRTPAKKCAPQMNPNAALSLAEAGLPGKPVLWAEEGGAQ